MNGLAQGWRRAYEAAVGPGASARDHAAWRHTIASVSERMDQVFGRAVATAIDVAGAQPGGRVLLLPTGAMAPLPIGLIRHPRTGRLLIDDYEITQAPSLFAFNYRANATPAPPSALILANASSGLSAAEAEGAAVASWFEGASPLATARAEDVPQRMRTATIWHFATHARFDAENPGASSLDLGGGQTLTLEQLASLQDFANVELVFLSACETGLAALNLGADEFIGLPFAFLELGARNVVATLWRVPDVSSALLTMKFYELYRGENQRASQALRHAQLWLRDTTARELFDYITAAATVGGRMTPEQAAPILLSIESALRRGADNRPFAEPYFWAGYVALGR